MYISKQKQFSPQPHITAALTDNATIGTVVSADDPQEMGRLKVVCPKWGDTYSTPIKDLPWVSYISPLAGTTSVGSRGAGLQESKGKVAYGFWAIPKVGAQVLVMCIDKDPAFRVYLGSMHTQLATHTLPHGRFTYDDHPAVPHDGSTPYGPFTSSEQPIEPLASNLKAAFGPSTSNYEWQTRAADYQSSAIGPNHVDYTESTSPDDYEVTDPLTGWKSTQGYDTARHDETDNDSKVLGITSPGFHSLSMDDRMENCRFRLRTTAGHQILMDDTNERIYISTAKGNNWVEMDQNGNVDVFSNNRVSVRSTKDINFTSDESIRLYARKGIHMVSETDLRIQTVDDIHVKSTGGNLRMGIAQSIFASAGSEMHLKSNGQFLTTSGGSMHLLSGGVSNISAADTINVNSGGSYVVTASTVHHNGPSAVVATSASVPSEQPAFWTNRVPTHEPFARTVTKDDFTHAPEHSYTSDLVNRVERGIKFVRGLFWRR